VAALGPLVHSAYAEVPRTPAATGR